jgi:phosphatidate phosphatase APP1
MKRRWLVALVAVILPGLAGLTLMSFLRPEWLTRLLPASSTLARDERVILFPAMGHREADGWRVPVHGWVYEPEDEDLVRQAMIARLHKVMDLSADEAASPVFTRRLRHFLSDNESRKKLSVLAAGKEHGLPATGRDGHFEELLTLPDAPSGELALRVARYEQFSGRAHLLADEGLTVISDIDDTVKISHVRDKKKLLRATFLEEFRAVEAIAERYRRWAQEGAHIHFVSSSPWQLFPELEAFFRQAGFPAATYSLKRVRAKDASVLTLLDDPFESKTATIEAILERFPNRRFILVGDSGEKDPEVYGHVTRSLKRPQQIVKIFIRDVTDQQPHHPRYREAFAGVARERWRIFRDARELLEM